MHYQKKGRKTKSRLFSNNTFNYKYKKLKDVQLESLSAAHTFSYTVYLSTNTYSATNGFRYTDLHISYIRHSDVSISP